MDPAPERRDTSSPIGVAPGAAPLPLPSADPALLDAAVDLLRQAGELTLQWFRSPDLAVDRKADGTPVTLADRSAEAFVRAELAQRYPDDAVVGEEQSDTTGSTGRTWIVDPIDGTKAFTRGVALYSNLLCVEDEHGPLVGVVNLPALGETVWAGRGLGCYWNGMPCSVSNIANLDGAAITTSSFSNWPDPVLALARRSGAALRTWGDGYGYALVATGRVEAMVDFEAARWDLAPMTVLLTEAGGRFTTLDGSPDAAGGSGLGSNGHLHDELLALLGGGG